MAYTLIRMKYRRGELTAAEVWAYADRGTITEEQAIKICGPRPKE